MGFYLLTWNLYTSTPTPKSANYGIFFMTKWIWMETAVWMLMNYGQHWPKQVIKVSSLSRLRYRSSHVLGIVLQPTTLTEFMNFLTSSPTPKAINFTEFRDFLLLMPRKASMIEIYRYYEVRKRLGDDGHGAARVNMEGEWSICNRHPRSWLTVCRRGCFLERGGSTWNKSKNKTKAAHKCY